MRLWAMPRAGSMTAPKLRRVYQFIALTSRLLSSMRGMRGVRVVVDMGSPSSFGVLSKERHGDGRGM